MSAAKKDTKAPDLEGVTREKKKKQEGGGGGVVGLVVLLVVLVIAGGGLFAIVNFNLFGARDSLISAVSKLDPEYVAYTEDLARLERELAEVEAAKFKNEAEAARLQKEKQDIQTTQTADKTPIYRRILNEDELAEMKSLGKIYSAMEAETAANILPKLYTVRDMATIIFYMDESSAAAVLSAMDAALAADITQELIIED